MAKQKPNYVQRRKKDEVNKKAIVWVGASLGAFVLLMAILLIWNP